MNIDELETGGWAVYGLGQLIFWMGLFCYIAIFTPIRSPEWVLGMLTNYIMAMVMPITIGAMFIVMSSDF